MFELYALCFPSFQAYIKIWGSENGAGRASRTAFRSAIQPSGASQSRPVTARSVRIPAIAAIIIHSGDIEMSKSLLFHSLAGAWLLAAGCTTKQQVADNADLKMFAPLPNTVPAKSSGPLEAQVALGRMLYYDTRL